ncbi:hypothetical protein DRO22_02510 [Candidatus Bathyarchaeota archaeon]|nr:MAG: hypothetical protein DRO22_02510 [Candidatus Bathyarchaeota archaeon]
MIDKIHKIHLGKGEVAIAWMGQNFYILKTPAGTTISIDPYMERSKEISYVHPEPPIKPEDLKVDFIFCTHDHRDHTDPVSLPIVAKHSLETIFLGPKESADHLVRLGVEKRRVKPLEARVKYRFKDFKVTPYYSIPPEEAKTTHFGYLFEIDETKIYNMGDTSRSVVKNAAIFLREVAERSPDIGIFPIIGDTPDRRPEDAYLFAEVIKPRIAIPCHYDCFADRTIDPEEFVNLFKDECEITPIVIAYKGIYIYNKKESGNPQK